MDLNAYHLQSPAHEAVGKAIACGELVRQPCEKCGQPSQAHHDSYKPENWLKVRWLCPVHHSEWHRENEPEWPTIYEFHPSDWIAEKSSFAKGRKPKPWYRTQRRSWYVTIGGKRYCLGKNYDEAYAKFEELLRSHLGHGILGKP